MEAKGLGLARRDWRARRPPAGRRRPRAGTRAGPPGRAGTRPRTDSPGVVAPAWPPAARRSGRAAGDAARRAGCATARGLDPGKRRASRARARRSAVDAGTSRSLAESERAIRRAAVSYPRTTWSWAMPAAASVTSAVTAGLPSRSPPTQVAHRKRTSLPAVRATRGNVVKIVRSNSAIVARTSSSGVGAARRTGSVSHRLVISSARRRSRSSRTRPAHRGSSSPSSRSPIRQRCSTTARRFASVGCAVRTSVTSTGCPIGVGTCPPGEPPRRSRTRCRSSATLTNWKNAVNARATDNASAGGMSATTRSTAAPRAFVGSACRRIVARRRASTRRYRPGPPCTRMASPSRVVSSRTSARRASGTGRPARSVPATSADVPTATPRTRRG